MPPLPPADSAGYTTEVFISVFTCSTDDIVSALTFCNRKRTRPLIEYRREWNGHVALHRTYHRAPRWCSNVYCLSLYIIEML